MKHCHGYLGHELLSGRQRPGRYGGSLENRTRFLRSIVDGIRATSPGLRIVVRLSAFDMVPFKKSESRRRRAGAAGAAVRIRVRPARQRDGGSRRRARRRARAALAARAAWAIRWVCITAGSPYYNPHMQRPALFPPSDGYLPPEDPLRRRRAADRRDRASLKKDFPSLAIVGSAYSYLQEWLPHVAQYNVRHGMTDFVGLGRMVLSYPDLPADVLAGRAAAAQTDLPHLQRLHHRPAPRPRVRLLPARPVLHGQA